MISQEKLEAMKLLKKEFEALKTNPITSLGITVGLVKENNLFQWKISMIGPKDTPHEGGVFFLQADFPDNYPRN